jgi:prevent-host-death family protein
MRSRLWTVSEAKAHLSEILRLASEEGPQRIGTRRRYVVVTESEWKEMSQPRQPIGRWLLDNIPQGEPIELPGRAEPTRPNPFDPETAA